MAVINVIQLNGQTILWIQWIYIDYLNSQIY